MLTDHKQFAYLFNFGRVARVIVRVWIVSFHVTAVLVRSFPTGNARNTPWFAAHISFASFWVRDFGNILSIIFHAFVHVFLGYFAIFKKGLQGNARGKGTLVGVCQARVPKRAKVHVAYPKESWVEFMSITRRGKYDY
jgi:hypothetical protein